ncbi:MAG TPA: nucleotidyltransferase family protein [Solirubrobacterales bacterium]|nr:nucleotidyltransferase family protein [Solirubrobacterales bacterium]
MTRAAPDAVRVAAICLLVDRVSAEVVSALRAAGVPSLLMKGPAISTWIYAGEPRSYADTDLLLREADWKRATAVLECLGFADDLAPLDRPRTGSLDSHPYVRAADGAAVDLHLTLFGIEAAPAEVWAAFTAEAVPLEVGGVQVAVPSYRARALHIAMHAVQHGGDAHPKPMRDLELALERVPREVWAEALELARELRAEAAFAAGLGLTGRGRSLAAAIGATSAPRSARARLRVEGTPLAEGFLELAATRRRDRLALLLAVLIPRPSFMRWWTPLARRGIRGLAAAYAWRWVWLLWRAVPGYVAWRRAARGSRRVA